MNGPFRVFGIYRYNTGIWPFFDSFWTGMVYWYAKVVWGQFDFLSLCGVEHVSETVVESLPRATSPSRLGRCCIVWEIRLRLLLYLRTGGSRVRMHV